MAKKALHKIPDPKYLGIPNICFSLTEKDDKREKKFSRQRKLRGFDNSETWWLHGTISSFIIPRLRDFKDSTNGYPMGMTSDKWDEIIDKMIRAFELAASDKWEIGYYDSPKTKEEKIRTKNYKEYEEGIKLFSEYFLELWW